MIEVAYQALVNRVAAALVNADFIPSASALEVDPAGAFSPSGDERELIRAASIFAVQTGAVRTLLGGAAPRYVVERRCQLELAVAGPMRGGLSDPMSAAKAAVALLPALAPTLEGKAERLVLIEQTDEDLPPNGSACLITFVIRVRSGDPLGCSA